MSDYQPGTVAMVTAVNRREPYRAFFDGSTWRDMACHAFCVDTPMTTRPLVVLDLEDPAAAVDYLHVATDGFHNAAMGMEAWSGRDPLRQIAAQIKAQTKPPRIPEPGLWGVVEARRDSERLAVKYVRRYDKNNGGYDWTPIDYANPKAGQSFRWSDLIDPTLVRDGIES